MFWRVSHLLLFCSQHQHPGSLKWFWPSSMFFLKVATEVDDSMSCWDPLPQIIGHWADSHQPSDQKNNLTNKMDWVWFIFSAVILWDEGWRAYLGSPLFLSLSEKSPLKVLVYRRMCASSFWGSEDMSCENFTGHDIVRGAREQIKIFSSSKIFETEAWI